MRSVGIEKNANKKMITKKRRELKVSRKGLLKEALALLRKDGDPIRDEVATIAYRVDHYILVAKDYIYGNIVSCHKRILNLAIKEGKRILFYIGDSKHFYSFSARQIDESIFFFHEGFVNHRGDIEMVNFPITWGKRFCPDHEAQIVFSF